MIGDGEVLPASLVAEGTGKPALSDTGGAGQQEPMTLSDPVAACEFEEQGTIKTTFGTEVGIFDLRVMAQPPERSALENAADVLAAGIQDITNTMVENFKLNDVLRMILETMFRALGFRRSIFLE